MILAAVLSIGILTPGIVAVTLVLLFALRVAFWGAVAMGCTAAVGRLFGTVVQEAWMKVMMLLGVLLIGIGMWVVSGHAVYKTRREVFKIGDMKAAVTEEHTLPSWIGYTSAAGGVALLVAAAARRRG